MRSRNECWRGNAKSITYSECVFVALVIQHAMRQRRLAVPHFFFFRRYNTSL